MIRSRVLRRASLSVRTEARKCFGGHKRVAEDVGQREGRERLDCAIEILEKAACSRGLGWGSGGGVGGVGGGLGASGLRRRQWGGEMGAAPGKNGGR